MSIATSTKNQSIQAGGMCRHLYSSIRATMLGDDRKISRQTHKDSETVAGRRVALLATGTTEVNSSLEDQRMPTDCWLLQQSNCAPAPLAELSVCLRGSVFGSSSSSTFKMHLCAETLKKWDASLCESYFNLLRKPYLECCRGNESKKNNKNNWRHFTLRGGGLILTKKPALLVHFYKWKLAKSAIKEGGGLDASWKMPRFWTHSPSCSPWLTDFRTVFVFTLGPSFPMVVILPDSFSF